MKKITLALASAATLALAAGAVYAQGPDRPARDADVTRAQAEEQSAAAFARMDANGDGVLDASDREARRTKRGEHRAERREARFERLDADSNGAISRAEFDAAHDQARERFAEHREHGERAGQHGRRGDRMGRFGGRFGGRGLLAGADGDGDKTVTRAEFTAAALERFDRADADRDGTVTQDERHAAMKAFREQRRAERGSAQS